MAFVASACFVVIPQTPEFAAVRQAVLDCLSQYSIDSWEASGPSTSDMMERVNFVIADVTSESPDVFYQLGVADALRKPTLMMAQKDVKLQGDLARHKLLVYKPEEISKLAEYVRYWLSNAIESQQQRIYSA